MCIPTCAQDPELAEIFMNYLLSENVAIASAEFIYCSVPNFLVYESKVYREDMGEEMMAMLYPEIGSFSQEYNRYAYRNLSQELLDLVNTLWETVKIN